MSDLYQYRDSAFEKQSDTQESSIVVPLSFLDNKTSLRDQFAMAALTGILSNDEAITVPALSVNWAYAHADEMLKQRKEGD